VSVVGAGRLRDGDAINKQKKNACAAQKQQNRCSRKKPKRQQTKVSD
jgi:hypothetical protein